MEGWGEREREREDGGMDETVGWGEVNGDLGMDGWMDLGLDRGHKPRTACELVPASAGT